MAVHANVYVMNIETIRSEALSLSLQARAELAEQLLCSLDTLPNGQNQNEIEALWLQVATRRATEIDQGLSKRISAAEVSAQAQALLQ